MTPRRRTALWVMFATTVIVVALAGFRRDAWRQAPRPPNVIVICMDGCRADHLGAWGYSRPTSPTVDRLSREGVTFTRNYSQANESLFSHASLFSSRFPAEISLPTYTHFAIPPTLATLTKRLKGMGYQTAGFTGGGHVNHTYGFGDGFDQYADEVPFASFSYSVPRALQWIEEHQDAPFYLFLHGYDCHRPYRKPTIFNHLYAPGYTGEADRYLASLQALDRVFKARFYEHFDLRESRTRTGDRPIDPTSYLDLERFAAEHPDAGLPLAPGDVPHIVGHYDAAITYADTWIGLFLAEIDRVGLDRSNTMVVVLSDHGEDLMEHGMFNHRFGLETSNLHVPLVFWGAGVAPGLAGRRYDTVTQNLDVAPTILSLLGASPLPDARGTDLAPLLTGVSPPDGKAVPSRPAFAEGVLGMTTVIDDDYQLIVRGAVPGTAAMAERIERARPTDASVSLYDLRRDPNEKASIAATPEAALALAERMRLLLAMERLVARARRPSTAPPIDEKLRRVLQEHGYW